MDNLRIILHARHDEDSTQVDFEVVDDTSGIYERFTVNVDYVRTGVRTREEALKHAHLQLAERLMLIAADLRGRAQHM